MAKATLNRQHEPVPIPHAWNGEELRFALQVETLFNMLFQISARQKDLDRIEARVKALEEENNAAAP